MKKNVLFTFLLALLPALAFLPLPMKAQWTGDGMPKREVRAAWLTSSYGLDWPRTRGTSAAAIRKQQEELLRILDRLQAARFNTVIFQTRLRGDVVYRSKTEPFSSILTGKSGTEPGYDPLAFAVEECHKRSMECHAWMVAIPLGSRKQMVSLGRNGMVKRRPDICLAYKQEYFLNPGNPKTKEYLAGLVREVVENYDVDGIQLDYLRYPERATRFPDRREYQRYGAGRSLEQWRRDNLTDIMRRVYQEVKRLKPWVKVSTCPVGKISDTSRYSSRGWNAYHTVYQDVQCWLAEGIQDQIYPMLYFRGNHFYPFVLDWQEESRGRQVVPGLGIYFLHPKEGNWKLEEVIRQLNFTRTGGVAGQGFYRVQYLMENTQGLYDMVADEFYTAPALPPALTWLDSIAPTAPTGLVIRRLSEESCELSWQPSTDNDTRNRPHYVVYGSDRWPVDIKDPRNILAQGLREPRFTYNPPRPGEGCASFAVTAIDRYGNESEPVQADFLDNSGEIPE